jgi:hypothetical protein
MAFWNKKKKQDGDEERVNYVWSQNALLRVAAPSGAGWQRMEAQPQAPMLAAIKCVHGEPPQALALDALLYQPSAEQLPSHEALCERDWRAHFEAKMFASVDSCDVRDIKHANPNGFNDPGCEVTVAGRLHTPDMAVVLRERHVVSGQRLLVASAAGPADEHANRRKVIDAWLEHASVGG